jgi:L-alanine-DL-glutamate epimerase-like enolase superfamily enzyme
MRITDLKASMIEIPYKEPGLFLLGSEIPEKSMKFVLVEMFTDEGIEGIGVQKDSSGTSLPLVRNIVRDFLVKNKISPLNTELISEFLGKIQVHGGQVSAVEIAAWDIVGKLANQPIGKLLGGYRDKMKVYVSTVELKPPQKRVEEVQQYIDQGFEAIKVKAHHVDPQKDLEVVRAIRKAVGNKMEIMVDAFQAQKTQSSIPPPWTRRTALKVAKCLEEYDVLWLEEPLPRYDTEGLTALCNAVDITIAGGESEYGIYTYKELLEKRAYDIVQCDVTLSGGFLETKKIAAMAQAFGKWCIPHAWGVGPRIIPNLHLCCAIPNCPYFEYSLEPPALDIDIRDMVMKQPLYAENGYVSLPSSPGLGIELNRKLIAKYTLPL